MIEFKTLKPTEKLYYIFSTITVLIVLFAIPLGMTHEMNPAWGIDIGLKNGYGWFLFGLLDVFTIWTIIVLTKEINGNSNGG